MATFTGTNGDDIANAANSTLVNFVGGSLAELTDHTNDVFNGGNGDDIIIAGHGSDTINGQGDNDTISGGDGVDHMDGGTGIDLLQLATLTTNYSVNLQNGATSIKGEKALNFEQVTTGSGNDLIVGSNGNNKLVGGAGDDTINGLGGSDEMNGGAGIDMLDLAANTLNYNLNMASGVTNIANETALGFEQVSTGTGDDQIIDTAQANLINTGDGDDTVLAGAGADTIDGGAGIDRFDNTAFGANYILNMATGGTNAGGETILNFEHVETGAGSDRITGTAGSNSIDGGAGNDRIDGGKGIDVMDGNAGRDQVMLLGAAAVAFNMQTGVIGAAGETALNFENVVTRSGNDAIIGSNSGNTIATGVGNDVVDARQGNDKVIGGFGLDTLNGGAGNDLVSGSAGNDRLTGGSGFDSFLFNAKLSTANNTDTITDFSGPNDTITLENGIFTGLALGALGNAAFHIGKAAADASDRIIYDAATGNLLFDVDGAGGKAQVQFAKVTANVAVLAGDFDVI